jgi:hypothetical protein
MGLVECIYCPLEDFEVSFYSLAEAPAH